MGACQSLPFAISQEHELSLQLSTNDQNQSSDSLKQDHLFQSLDFFLSFENDYISLKKLATISRSPQNIKSACYIPERNLLLALARDSKTICIYNTLRNFNLIAKKTANVQLDVLIHSKDLHKIIVGGEFLQIWSPKNFQVEAQCQIPDYSYVLALTYVPSSDIIIVKTGTILLIYGRSLAVLMRFPFPSYEEKNWSSAIEIFALTKGLLLGLYHEKDPKLFLLNLKKKTLKIYDQLDFRYGSCLQMTQETPSKIFTCLAIPKVRSKSESSYQGRYPFKMIRFMVNPKTEELVVLKMSKTSHYFQSVMRLGNTKYFLAENFDHSDEIVMLSLTKGNVEVTRVVSNPISPFSSLPNFALIMLKDESSIVYINNNGMWLYRFAIKSDNSNKSTDSESFFEFCAPVGQRKTGVKIHF